MGGDNTHTHTKENELNYTANSRFLFVFFLREFFPEYLIKTILVDTFFPGRFLL